jgi:hypothetical protein
MHLRQVPATPLPRAKIGISLPRHTTRKEREVAKGTNRERRHHRTVSYRPGSPCLGLGPAIFHVKTYLFANHVFTNATLIYTVFLTPECVTDLYIYLYLYLWIILFKGIGMCMLRKIYLQTKSRLIFSRYRKIYNPYVYLRK